MSELYDKLKEYWNGKLGKYGDELVREHAKELKAYSDEWNLIGSKYFVPKCTANEGRCTEKNSCKK